MRFPPLSSWMRGRKVVDRGWGVSPSFAPSPVEPTVGEIIDEMHEFLDAKYGVNHCPNCGEKVAVLVEGVCRDCSPDVA